MQSDLSISGQDFAVMPPAAVAGHCEIFNALQNKTEQNSENTRLFQRNVNCCKTERRQTLRAKKFYYLRIYSSIFKDNLSLQNEKLDESELNEQTFYQKFKNASHIINYLLTSTARSLR